MTTSAPTWEQYLAPTLTVLSNGQVWRSRELIREAAELLGVTAEQRRIFIPSGQEQWLNRGNWALSYLYRAAAVERVSRGHYLLTEVGRQLLAEHPRGIRNRHLAELTVTQPAGPPGEFSAAESGSTEADSYLLDPTEQIAAGIAQIEADVASQLLLRLHANEPAFFEQAVLDLIMAMGYGGANGTATRTQLSNDGGIDGIVDQDALGLSRIYLQAKRYGPGNTVGRPDIQAFVGALHGAQASQGVFLTTGQFSSAARVYAETVATRVVLIDGDRLASLMIRYGVGVQVKRMVNIIEVDEDFFE